MTIITLSRTPDLDKALSTDAGKQLTDILGFLVNDLADQTIRTLRNGISLVDNVNALVSTVSLTHDTWAEIATGGKLPTQILFGRVASATYLLAAHGWYMDERGKLQVKVQFTPVPTAALSVTLTILF